MKRGADFGGGYGDGGFGGSVGGFGGGRGGGGFGGGRGRGSFGRGGGGGGGGRGGGGGGGGGFNGGDGPKRFRNAQGGGGFGGDPSKLEVRVLIPSNVAGRIIGKGGENVKRLRTEFKANVSIPDSPAPERIVYVIAELDNAGDVVADVLTKLDENRAKDYPEQKGVELKILVHKSQAGAIIGRGGVKIKELRETTKTNLKVFPESCPLSTDRVVVIAGSPDNMILAMKEILKAVNETPIKGPSEQYDTVNYDGNNLSEYGGYPPDRNFRGGPGPRGAMGGMGGMGGMSGMSGQAGGYGAPMGMGMGMGGGGGMGSQGYGGVGGGIGSQGYGGGGNRSYNMGNGAGLGIGGMMGGQGGGMGGGMNYGGPQMGGGDAAPQTSQVTIPKELAGTIIGRGGERLKSIREESGAHVVVEPLDAGANDRIISITGSQQSIQMAQYLLQQTVRTSQYGGQFD